MAGKDCTMTLWVSRHQIGIICHYNVIENLVKPLKPVHSPPCPHDFQFPSAQPDIPSIYFYSQDGVVVEEISGRAQVFDKWTVLRC